MNTTGVLNPNLLTMPGILSNPFGARRGQTGLAVRKPPISEMLMRREPLVYRRHRSPPPAQLGAMFGPLRTDYGCQQRPAPSTNYALDRQPSLCADLSASNLKKQQKGEVYVDTGNNQYREVFDPMSGRSAFQNVETGEVVNPSRRVQCTATERGQDALMSKNDYEAESAFGAGASEVPEN